VPRDQKFRIERAQDLFDGQNNVIGIGNILEQKREFISADPCDRVGFAQLPFQQFRGPGQQLIACVMSEAVIDVLELIEIQKHDRQSGTLPLRAIDCVFETRVERDAIG
jgi:hypothetical protein